MAPNCVLLPLVTFPTRGCCPRKEKSNWMQELLLLEAFFGTLVLYEAKKKPKSDHLISSRSVKVGGRGGFPCPHLELVVECWGWAALGIVPFPGLFPLPQPGTEAPTGKNPGVKCVSPRKRLAQAGSLLVHGEDTPGGRGGSSVPQATPRQLCTQVRNASAQGQSQITFSEQEGRTRH